MDTRKINLLTIYMNLVYLVISYREFKKYKQKMEIKKLENIINNKLIKKTK